MRTGEKMKGAEVLVQMLLEYKVEVIFGVPGDTSLPLYEAIYDAAPKIRHVMARDERSASFMADAYARNAHKPGICECPSGAGAKGLDEAFATQAPVFLDVVTESESTELPPVYSWLTKVKKER